MQKILTSLPQHAHTRIWLYLSIGTSYYVYIGLNLHINTVIYKINLITL